MPSAVNNIFKDSPEIHLETENKISQRVFLVVAIIIGIAAIVFGGPVGGLCAIGAGYTIIKLLSTDLEDVSETSRAQLENTWACSEILPILNQGNTCFAAATLQLVVNNESLSNLFLQLLPEDYCARKVLERYKNNQNIDIREMRQVWSGDRATSTEQEDAAELMEAISEKIDNQMKAQPNCDLDAGLQIRNNGNDWIAEPTSLLRPVGLDFVDSSLLGMITSRIVDETSLQFTKTPETLLFKLNRFIQDDEGNEEKITTLVDCPLELDMPQELIPGANSLRYKLSGFIYHIGSLNGGHYVAYLCKGDKYYRVSDGDSCIEILQNEYLNAAKSAYILNYSRVQE